MKQNKIKILVFLILIILLYYIYHICFNVESLPDVDFNNLDYNENLVTGLYVDDVLCSYDSDLGVFYSNNNDVSNISFYSMYDHLRYTVSNVSDDLYSIYVYNDIYYSKLDLVITAVPLVNIYTFDKEKYDRYSTNFSFPLFQNDNDDNDNLFIKFSINNVLQKNGRKAFSSSGIMSQRGASSTFFDKKSYKIELDENLSMYAVKSDNIWVLDALYTDNSKIRNKLSSDLWNMFNDNQLINNDLECIFVEVFIDNHYAGLYTFKEKVDKSVTRNNDDGLLLKATMHLLDDRISIFLSNPHNITKNMILNFEIKEYTEKSLNNFIDNMYSYYSGSRDYQSISEYYYVDNYINYILFVSFISGEDNISSNQYHSMINSQSKILITPWDMDLTWGLYWNLDKPLHSEYLSEKNFDASWLSDNVFNNVDQKTFSLIKKRYWQLRNNVLNMKTINNYLDNYEELLVNSGAAMRDSERWYEYDIEYEIDQIREWSEKRIVFLDEYFK